MSNLISFFLDTSSDQLVHVIVSFFRLWLILMCYINIMISHRPGQVVAAVCIGHGYVMKFSGKTYIILCYYVML